MAEQHEMNRQAADEFWAWFAAHENRIRYDIRFNGTRSIAEIDRRLDEIFPYRAGELEFQLGLKDGFGEFFFFHFGDSRLKKDGRKLARCMPHELAQRWTYILEA